MSAAVPPVYEASTETPSQATTAARSADPFASSFQASHVVVIHERGVHIPSFYERHPNPSEITVRENGLPILSLGKPFTVADVAPERRWAIGLEGEVMPQHVFTSNLERVRYEYYQRAFDAPQKPPGDLSKYHVPAVKQYVSMTVDPITPSRLKPIHYDAAAKAPSDAQALYDANEDRLIMGSERLAILRAAYNDPATRDKLRPEEVALVEEANGGSTDPVRGESDLMQRLVDLNAKLQAGDLSREEHAAQVSALTGHVPVAAQEAVSETPKEAPKKRGAPKSQMACGEEVFNLHRKRHIESCEVCQNA
jgi:hypothetical protein